MAYVRPNFRTKKALREALRAGEPVEVFQPGIGTIPNDGPVTLEGPWHPQPHTWYARGIMKNGQLTRLVS